VAPPRRDTVLALATAALGYPRPRLRRGAEPVHDHGQREAARGRRCRRQGRHVLRHRPGRREPRHRRALGRCRSLLAPLPAPPAPPSCRPPVVRGGEIGGIVATAAVDERARRVYFSTAPGNDADLFNPQRPTVHALDADTGAIVWQNTAEPNADASFAPTSAI